MAISENVKQRKAAEALLAQFVELVSDEYIKLTPYAQQCFCQALHDRMAKNLKLKCSPNATPPTAEKPAKEPAVVLDWEQAVEKLSEIIENCDSIPDKGSEFAESVSETATGMQTAIENSRSVTKNQLRAIDNWDRAVLRWIENDR